MKRMNLAMAGLGMLGALALAGCGASTELTNVWTAPGFQENSLRKLMIIGVAQNTTVRHNFEDAFAAALKSKGFQATPSYSATGDGNLDSVAIVNAVHQGGCDGVFLTRLVDQKTVQTYYAPTTTMVAGPGSYYYGGWYGYYSTGYAYTSTPGYTVENQVLHIETNLYRISDSKLIWSALSESWLESGSSPGKEINPFVDALVYGLERSKVVTKIKK